VTVSTEHATPPKSTKSRNSNFSVPIQIKSKSQFEFVLRDTEESESLDLVDFGGAAFSVETGVTPLSHTGLTTHCCGVLRCVLLTNCVRERNTLQHTATVRRKSIHMIT